MNNYRNDFLTRQPYLDFLKSIIANRSNNSSGYYFAIDGEWGCGKTWILTKLECQLEENSDIKYLIFHYNAWKNDFYDEPLVAILSVMIDKLNQVTSQKCIYEAAIDELLRQASADLLTLVSGIVKEATKIDAEKIIRRKKGFFRRIKENKKLTAKDINTLVPLQHTLQEVRNNLKKLSEKFHIILIVDELDRCLPEYAIKVLERLHHVCNEMPVIQILAINKKNLADSISSVFGKNFYNSPYSDEQTNQFAESYLQKFIDTIIPLPNGHPDSKLEILNGLEEKYNPYIRPDNIGRPFINLDENFVAECISSIMNGVERRLQEKIFKQVSLCHELTLKSNITIDEERITYAFLIYELLSCITKFLLHYNTMFFVREAATKQSFILSLYQVDGMSKTVYETEHSTIISNIEVFFSVPKIQNQAGQFIDTVFIRDTKSYLMAFFIDKLKFPYWTFESAVWGWIEEDKVFLKKYDEIMDMLVKK